MGETEQKSWDLTEEEKQQLLRLGERKAAIGELLAGLLKLEAQLVADTNAWWRAWTIAHGIPEKYCYRLCGHAQLGKAWVKNEVPELDIIAADISE